MAKYVVAPVDAIIFKAPIYLPRFSAARRNCFALLSRVPSGNLCEMCIWFGHYNRFSSPRVVTVTDCKRYRSYLLADGFAFHRDWSVSWRAFIEFFPSAMISIDRRRANCQF